MRRQVIQVSGIRTPDRGSIAVLGLDPFRDVYELQERIGVQLQQAQLQKRIKVWEAVQLWASFYRIASIVPTVRPAQPSFVAGVSVGVGERGGENMKSDR